MTDFDPNIPFYTLPDLPPPVEQIESKEILKQCIKSRVALADPAPDVSQAASDAEDKLMVGQLVEKLSPRQQEVLRLRLQGGLSYREIADVTGLTVSNVGFHLHEAVRNLREILAVR